MATKRVTNTEKKTTAPKRVRAADVVHAEGLFDRPNEEQIARRAFELFQRRGGQHGHHVEDWLAAERELLKD